MSGSTNRGHRRIAVEFKRRWPAMFAAYCVEPSMTGLAAIVAERALSPNPPREIPSGAAPYDVVLHALSVMCGADAAGIGSADLKAGMFRAAAWRWFSRGARG